MLNVPILDDSSYEIMVTRARGRIPLYTDDWTDFNDHDPGITTLQTFAWLVDSLNYYIDATGEDHRLGYLRLLGIVPEREAARCLVALEGEGKEIHALRGAVMPAGDVPFELEESYAGASNTVTALIQEIGGSFTDLTAFAGRDGGYATLFTHERYSGCALYIGFENSLGGELRFYADIKPHPGRSPFEDDFSLVGFAWEYYDGSGWQEAVIESDGTGGFLKSGFISLKIAGKSKAVTKNPSLPKAHYIRVRVVRGGYDALPRLGKIYANCAVAVQTETLSQALELDFNGSPVVEIDYHVRENDLISVAVSNGDGYSLWFEHTADEDSLCAVEVGGYPGQRVIRFDKKRFGAYPEQGQKLLVIIAGERMYDALQIGATSGFSRERIETDLENVHELRLALVNNRDGRPWMRLWDEYDDLAGAGFDVRAFRFDRGTGEITFGDSIAGIQPVAGQRVVAVTAKTSLLGGGNVRAGQINGFEGDMPDGLTSININDAAGGKSPKTSSELEQEIKGHIYKTTRAVTSQDYIEIVKSTPGLIIDGANVISSREYARFYGGAYHPGTVLLAVKPFGERAPRPALSEEYRARVRANLERYRLLTVNIQILSAKYVRVDVDGRIALTENTPAARRMVEEKLRELTNLADDCKFGAGIVYGRVFSHLEMLECVSKVTQLSFSCTGEGARKSEYGDIIVFPDALAWLGGINIEFV
ncbi:MAG: baseplate J/gp47 family protein [Oscillospiraceae bacterium]|nr:baseplate J/gp47 family protein [Oscillospiraceae bacterium]